MGGERPQVSFQNFLSRKSFSFWNETNFSQWQVEVQLCVTQFIANSLRYQIFDFVEMCL